MSKITPFLLIKGHWYAAIYHNGIHDRMRNEIDNGIPIFQR